MPEQVLDQRKRVLIVDQSADSRSVLRMALERRGVQILEAPGARQGLEIVREHHPEVVVLDLESGAAEETAMRAAYESELTGRRAELVILGNLRRCEVTADQHLVRKPYHYGPLIRKIEQLIEHSANYRQ
jgi:CheY-like chemotaxis protein